MYDLSEFMDLEIKAGDYLQLIKTLMIIGKTTDFLPDTKKDKHVGFMLIKFIEAAGYNYFQ